MAWCAKGRGNRELEGGYLLSDSDSEEEGLVDDDSMNDTDPPFDSELELDPADEELHHEPGTGRSADEAKSSGRATFGSRELGVSYNTSC